MENIQRNIFFYKCETPFAHLKKVGTKLVFPDNMDDFTEKLPFDNLHNMIKECIKESKKTLDDLVKTPFLVPKCMENTIPQQCVKLEFDYIQRKKDDVPKDSVDSVDKIRGTRVYLGDTPVSSNPTRAYLGDNRQKICSSTRNGEYIEVLIRYCQGTGTDSLPLEMEVTSMVSGVLYFEAAKPGSCHEPAKPGSYLEPAKPGSYLEPAKPGFEQYSRSKIEQAIAEHLSVLGVPKGAEKGAETEALQELFVGIDAAVATGRLPHLVKLDIYDVTLIEPECGYELPLLPTDDDDCDHWG